MGLTILILVDFSGKRELFLGKSIKATHLILLIRTSMRYMPIRVRFGAVIYEGCGHALSSLFLLSSAEQEQKSG